MKLGVAILAVAALLSAAALTFGQDIVPIKVTAIVKVMPNKAGTPKHPQPIKVDVRGTIDIPHDYDPPLVESVTIWTDRGGIYNGHKFPICNFQALRRSGPEVCPRRSIMGNATFKADADGVTTYPKATIINGGATKIYIYAMLSQPARVREALVMTITKLSSGPWGYRLHLKIPRKLQIVAGVPLRAEAFHVVVGREDWLASISCPPDRKWRWRAEGRYASGQIVPASGTVACRS